MRVHPGVGAAILAVFYFLVAALACGLIHLLHLRPWAEIVIDSVFAAGAVVALLQSDPPEFIGRISKADRALLALNDLPTDIRLEVNGSHSIRALYPRWFGFYWVTNSVESSYSTIEEFKRAERRRKERLREEELERTWKSILETENINQEPNTD